MTDSIDIQKIDELNIEKAEDQDTLASMVETCYNKSKPYIDRLARVWEENVRFFEGDQYIYWSDKNKRHEEIPTSKYNDYIPRPVTNMLLPIGMTVTSVMTNSKPTAMVYPNSEQEQDENAAQIGEMVLDAKWEMDEEQLMLIDAALIKLLCGTVFRKDYWDETKGPRSVVLDGRPVGDNAVKMLSPFEVIPDIESEQWFCEATVQSLSYVNNAFKKKGNGYTGRAEDVKPAKNLSTALSYRERLRASTGLGSGGSSESYTSDNSVVLVEFYMKPTTKHPKGLMVVEANGVALYVSESPYFDEKVEGSWHPYTKDVWIRSPLRYHGVSLFENLVPLQRRLNGIDSLIMLNRMTMVAGQWLLPKGCGVPEGYLNGRPGLNVTYRPVGANGASPQKVPGVGLPADVMAERQKVVEEMHRIAMDNEVLGGYQPSGVNTAAALNMLLEQTFSKFSPFIQSWEKFIEKGQQKKLLLIAKRYKENRPELVKYIQSLNSEAMEIQVHDFQGADLRDNLHVRIEAGSSLPRSKVVEQQQYMQLAQMGLLGDITPEGNPQGNKEFLEKFGIGSFESVVNPDIEKAKYVVRLLHRLDKDPEGSASLEMPKIMPYDDLNVHMQILVDEMKKPEFKDAQGFFKARFDKLMSAKEELEGEQQMGDELQVPPLPGQPGPVAEGPQEGLDAMGMPLPPEVALNTVG